MNTQKHGYIAKRISQCGIPTYGDKDIVISSATPIKLNSIIDCNMGRYIVYIDLDEVKAEVEIKE